MGYFLLKKSPKKQIQVSRFCSNLLKESNIIHLQKLRFPQFMKQIQLLPSDLKWSQNWRSPTTLEKVTNTNPKRVTRKKLLEGFFGETKMFVSTWRHRNLANLCAPSNLRIFAPYRRCLFVLASLASHPMRWRRCFLCVFFSPKGEQNWGFIRIY